MLITSHRHRDSDLAQWRADSRVDAINADRREAALDAKGAQAAEAAREFASHGPCYVGCSWGKDSVSLVHALWAHGVRLPVVWVRVDGRENPDCVLVRDAFLARFDIDYHEIAAPAGQRRTSELGFREAARRFGDRHISGVRGQEATYRALRMRRWGVSTERTCAPIGHWSTAEVFAYMHLHDLPVHPAYAQTGHGAWKRDRIRVGSLGGSRGSGHGRTEWEELYYPDEMRAIRLSA